MEAIQPKGAVETQLMKKENWSLATRVDCYWHEDQCKCDVCKARISGRHMIDGVLSGTFQFALMCPSCHKSKGDGLGDGKGQLYSKLKSGKWLQTSGFTEYQLDDEDDMKDDEWGFL
jgi:hypothetical protein